MTAGAPWMIKAGFKKAPECTTKVLQGAKGYSPAHGCWINRLWSYSHHHRHAMQENICHLHLGLVVRMLVDPFVGHGRWSSGACVHRPLSAQQPKDSAEDGCCILCRGTAHCALQVLVAKLMGKN
jgi:hypothetical protein